MKAKNCLVTGATGVIGPGLVRALVQKGYTVRVLSREAPAVGLLPKETAIVRGDLLDGRVLANACNGVDTVFHLAAKLHFDTPNPDSEQEYQAVNVEGTRLLLDSTIKAGARKFVYFSSICVYGPSKNGQVFSERSAVSPSTPYSKTKYEAENLVLSPNATTHGLESVVLRLAAVYGPRMKGNYPRLVNALRNRYFFGIGDGGNRRTLVHQCDVISAALLVAEHPKVGGETYNVTDGYVYTFREILAAICKAVGKPVPKLHFPVAPVQVLAGMIEDVFRLTGRSAPMSRDTVAKLLEDVAVSGEKIKRELGFQPQFDLIKGWQQTLNGAG